MITKVVVHQAEGLIRDCVPVTFTGPDAELRANAKLASISRKAPKDGSYYKCDVTITLDNGEEIQCRHDVQFNNPDGAVREHAVRFLKYVADGKANMSKEYVADAAKLLALLEK